MARWACVIGFPVKHSLSPAMHNAAFQALGIEAQYDAREVRPDELEATVQRFREPACLGANVTAPHKQAIIPLLDDLADEARRLGAVNTVIQRDGRLLGDNTDAAGLQRWFREAGILLAGRDALVLGAGGAARSAVLALARAGAHSVLVLNRTPARATTLVADLASSVPGTELSAGNIAAATAPAARGYAAVINATSLSHQGGTPEMHPSWFGAGCIAVDLAYNPPRTGFMRAARDAGARTENGLGMLVHQAVLAFERWTGQTPPVSVFAEAARQGLGHAGTRRIPEGALE